MRRGPSSTLRESLVGLLRNAFGILRATPVWCTGATSTCYSFAEEMPHQCLANCARNGSIALGSTVSQVMPRYVAARVAPT